MRRLIIGTLCTFSLAATLSAAPTKITKKELGDQWPFTVTEGVLACLPAGAVIFAAEGVTYAVNGTAKGLKKYAAIEKIWLPNPEIPGTRKKIGPVLDRGLKLCR